MVDSKKQRPSIQTSRHHPPMEKSPKVKNVTGTLRRIWGYMESNQKRFLLVLFFVFLSSILALLGPYLIGIAVDTITGEVSSIHFTTILWMLAFVFLFHSITLALQNYWMIGIAQQTVYRMRKDSFSHVLDLPVIQFERTQSGDVMSRLTNDIENVSRTLNTAVIQLSTSLLTLIGTLCVMFWLSPLLTWMTLTIVPLMYFGMKWITKRTRVYFKEQQKELGEMNGFIEESLSGHAMVKLFHQEQRMIDTFAQHNRRLQKVGYWAQVYSGFIPKVMNTLNNFSFAIIVGIGGWLAIATNASTVSIGVIVTFTTYARQFTRPLNDIANQFNTILSAIAGAERVFQIMDQEKEEVIDQRKEWLGEMKGDVRFQEVSFSYTEEEKVLNRVSFHVQSGEMVAIVGPTGAGKTTIVSLLAQFYEADQGEIFIDGVDTSTIQKQTIRKQLGMVLQDAYLFETTIRENIRYGNIDASDQQVEEAAQLANAHAFIEQLPHQYDTLLEGNGQGISQGQRQLLAIARAVLADPAILILDEATSSIDTITEMKINEALGRLMKGRTSFVIAHRLHTIQNADQILMLRNGEIIEQGTHTELVQRNGYYRHLLTTQQMMFE
ncbi:ABC-type transport system ATP-binding/permease protein [Gracilibacillus halophilus YIM-C55.5]|uniref:ABC-type transport system ATP-binding/permease protein n=1 Tax=Gracilibacillus halophilus YIM-C55.5 TaxID=1308866 RepID=N4WNM7_9BACI|nr:ABC transporter ATP-binding protein [Gracilibacillus halophilus]ENH97752.1 ABC-type transport system ATP-binding/permease protein [Gracilibacillus halophilus YIM-C55.5]